MRRLYHKKKPGFQQETGRGSVFQVSSMKMTMASMASSRRKML